MAGRAFRLLLHHVRFRRRFKEAMAADSDRVSSSESYRAFSADFQIFGKEKGALAAIARAKAGPDESRYLRLLQRHGRLREAILGIGSE